MFRPVVAQELMACTEVTIMYACIRVFRNLNSAYVCQWNQHALFNDAVEAHSYAVALFVSYFYSLVLNSFNKL